MSGPATTRRPTQADIARAAGVSQTVVSLVLNDCSLVAIAPATRNRVRSVAEQLGYVTDGPARSLRTGQSLLVASLIPDITNPFYPAFERGIQDLADARGYDLVAFNTDGLRPKELRALRSVQRTRVDGVIATPFQLTVADFAPLLAQSVPVVIFGELTDEPETPAFDSVVIDDDTAAGELVAYLIDRGYRPIAMIAGSAEVLRREGRVRAYQRLLAQRGLPQAEMVARGADPTEAGGYVAMRELLTQPTRPRAVFAANDMMALGALVAIREQGLRVPEDIAVAGFDDITVARLANPPLTTVAQFPEQLGRRAAELLFARLAGTVQGPGQRIALPYQLIVRASA